MIKLLALYRTPDDVEAFMTHYRDVHLPIARTIPGLVSSEVTSVAATLIGEPGNFLLAELRFEDEASYKAAMKSPENAAAGKDLMGFAGELVTLMKGEVLDL